MEKIKVNMNPNPLDVQTIHASQNDGEAREWEFELHNNGELIDTSNVTEQMFFKAYKGGTEQILPENTSTPTTSPFKGDIRYPQGLLTDQEFLYRESPTESDGLAKITDIKGNTLVWNQLANAGTLSATASYSGYLNIGTFSFVANHKYLIKYSQDNAMSSNSRNTLQVRFNTVGATITQNPNPNVNLSKGEYYWLYTSANTDADTRVRIWIADNDVAVSYSSIMLFDLTQMGLDSITSVDEFTSLFSLPYYDYNAGSLLSFNGTGLKTGGENLIDFSTLQIGKNWWKGSAVDRAIIEFPVEENKEYTISFDYSSNILNTTIIYRTGWNTGQIGNIGIGTAKEYTFTTPSTCRVVCIQFNARVNGFVLSMSDFYGFWNCALTDTFSTKALPVSTYFPTGMKSAGSVYDELTENKAITKMGSITFNGTENYVEAYLSGAQCRVLYSVSDILPATLPSSQIDDSLVSNYLMPSSNEKTWSGGAGIHRRINGATQIMISLGLASGITTVEGWNSYLSAHPLTIYYPLATPTETPITTASLVTENAEIPLSAENDVLVGKCTEELSAEPGFHDAKIKLSDSDGTCYSNKLQLHIERSPQ